MTTLAVFGGGSTATLYKIALSLGVILLMWLLKRGSCLLVQRRVTDLVRLYHWRRSFGYLYAGVGLVLLLWIWLQGIGSVATVLGLASAGLAVAMHDTIANLAGWLFILWRRPFEVGDRIQIGETAGDVIDIRLFQFSLIEIGHWVDAEQSTGRIVHVPNSKVLRDSLANYETGFQYIWHEIPVLITFESNWQQAKAILTSIAAAKAEHLSAGAQEQIRRAAMRYLVYFRNLTPIVYTTVKESGVLLTIRYIVKPRARRNSEEQVWEAILEEFGRHPDIQLAYPTTRFTSAPADAVPVKEEGS